MGIEFDDAIAALASAAGPAAGGIIRVSGLQIREILSRMFVVNDLSSWQQARCAARHSGFFKMATVDLALPLSVYLWPTHRSYTGQPMAELHMVGSPPLLESVLSTLFAAGVRPARPGEFTLRAFLAGRMDLVQAEAVLGVIEAFDHEELEQALQQLAGGLSGRLAAVRGDLIGLVSDLEAGLDFVEEDIESVFRTELKSRIQHAIRSLELLLEQSDRRMQSTGRQRVVLTGLPNAGKSTLFNALCGWPAALVSELRGTTRDYLTAQLELKSVSIELIDTAGWESSVDVIAGAAQKLRNAQIDHADLIVWCTAFDLDDATFEHDQAMLRNLRRQPIPVLWVTTKGDMSVTPIGLGGNGSNRSTESSGLSSYRDRSYPNSTLVVSAATGNGLEDFAAAVSAQLVQKHRGDRQMLGTTAARCLDSLARSIGSLQNAVRTVENAAGEELVVVELQESLEYLGRILGDVFTDDILDRIFSNFCIGK